MVECRTRDAEVPGSNLSVAKKKISHRSNQNNTTTNPSAPELNTWNCQRWKPEVTVAQWQSAGLEIQRFQVQTLVLAKKKISHRSNQNNTTTNPSAPELNTWNCQRWNPEIAVAQKSLWHSGRVQSNQNNTTTNPLEIPEIIRGPKIVAQWFKLGTVWPKRKSLTGPIRTIPPPIHLHQS